MINPVLNRADLATIFANQKPFPHVVIDNFLIDEEFEKITNAVKMLYSKSSSDSAGVTWKTEAELNKWGSSGTQLPSELINLEAFLSSKEILNFLQDVTGFVNLQCTEQTNSLGYSFLHAMIPGAFLAPHTDHTMDMNGSNSYHVLNIVYYVSESWNANWGGGTSLHKANGDIYTDVEYKPNRAVVFMHSPISVHGTTEVAKFAQANRFSVYFDYYSQEATPYQHLDIKKFKMAWAPHLFYLKSFGSYFKAKNSKYLRYWYAHYKSHLKAMLFGKRSSH
jgi:hypothetical protein